MRNGGNWRETEESPTHRLRKLLQKRSVLTIFSTFRKAFLVHAWKCSPLLPTIMSTCPTWWAVNGVSWSIGRLEALFSLHLCAFTAVSGMHFRSCCSP